MNKGTFEITQKKFALLNEVDTSIRLIKLGFGELQNINKSNDFYFLPFQLLSQGFERLLKTMICIAYNEKNKTYPEFKYLKNLGHDLINLTDDFTKNYYVKHRPILEQDLEFITNSKELRRLLFIISEFGKMARYYNFDIITGGNTTGINPIDLWKQYEGDIIFKDLKLAGKIENMELSDEIYGDISRNIIILFEKYVSSLCRQFTLGALGPHGAQLSSFVSEFITLKEYGEKDYRKYTLRFQQQPRKSHKRNFIDFLQRHFKSSYKHRIVNREDYTGEWPFYVDKVIVECRDQHWCVITIDGYDYALNGSAKSRFKLENPHDAGQAILGKGFSDFINLALQLDERNIEK